MLPQPEGRDPQRKGTGAASGPFSSAGRGFRGLSPEKEPSFLSGLSRFPGMASIRAELRIHSFSGEYCVPFCTEYIPSRFRGLRKGAENKERTGFEARCADPRTERTRAYPPGIPSLPSCFRFQGTVEVGGRRAAVDQNIRTGDERAFFT